MTLLEEHNEISIRSFPKELSIVIVGDILFILHAIFLISSPTNHNLSVSIS